jgi:hypothetical protein
VNITKIKKLKRFLQIFFMHAEPFLVILFA